MVSSWRSRRPCSRLGWARSARSWRATRSSARQRRRAAAYGRALEREVAERTRELRTTQLEVLQRLSQAVEQRDSETGTHIKRMSQLCGLLARASGVSESEAEEIEQASILHDVGKIAISDEILHKPGKLTPGDAGSLHGPLGQRPPGVPTPHGSRAARDGMSARTGSSGHA